MTGAFVTGVALQQILALGLVAAFVGAVRILDRVHQSAVLRPSEARSDSDPMRGDWRRDTRTLE